jgi:hypothetical protein
MNARRGCDDEDNHNSAFHRSPCPPEENESRSLQYILGGGSPSVTDFFEHIWQVSCAVYTTTAPPISAASDSSNRTSSAQQQQQEQPWNWERVQENPIRELVQNGFTVLTDLMESSSKRSAPEPQAAMAMEHSSPNNSNSLHTESMPLLFRDQQMVPMSERTEKYSDCGIPVGADAAATPTNLWAAFLDGCSVVVNHADEQSPWIAAVCHDLQRSLPHAYANAYLTPAHCQAVPAHADDRDVFIVQVHGRKRWTVYQTVPVPYPYPHEQVGKSETRPVPDAVSNGPVLLQQTLGPGDVLYMPRGYVHQAVSCPDCCSFHITIALATHDWSLAGLLSAASQSAFARQIDFRKAVDRRWGRAGVVDDPAVVDQLQAQLNRALQVLRDEATVANIDAALRNKYQRHNQRADAIREPLLRQGYCSAGAVAKTTSAGCVAVVGPEAADSVTLSTWLRAATEDEKANLLREQQQLATTALLADSGPAPQRGLHVREEIYEGILEMIQHLKLNPTSFCQVGQLRSLTNPTNATSTSMICDLTLVSMARRCVELGALALYTTATQAIK